ncbi:cytochrome c [Dyella psychrodurans]|uniref:Cytochrome c n=1 Tax=Dyella psychrodurans TaxID=1927960 RepID=A0A370XD16_9GAMM|nr:cytochrome c [Dyella psychrodurans]RDS86105.1 cytochrome c [Dyella psychrodurans]
MKPLLVMQCAVALVLAASGASMAQEHQSTPVAIHSVSVELPSSTATFPAGAGSDIAGKCLICHSAGMVLRQPALTQSEWKTEINRMRNAYGAPILDSEVEALSAYLTKVNADQQRQ